MLLIDKIMIKYQKEYYKIQKKQVIKYTYKVNNRNYNKMINIPYYKEICIIKIEINIHLLTYIIYH